MTLQKEILEFRVQLQRLEGQIERLVSDAESEKETKLRRNMAYDNDIKEIRNDIVKLKEWRSDIRGRILVTGIIVGAIVTVACGLLVWLITK